jgi:AcrR family transcriptional regulator
MNRPKRMTLAERGEDLRERMLAAAEETFLAQGYHATSLAQVCEAAGFTTGAVYSRFGSKADLFLALLERRIDERVALNRTFARADGDAATLVRDEARRWAEAVLLSEPWALLVAEFRLHAARDPVLAARYAPLHQRNLDSAIETLRRLYAHLPAAPTIAVEEFAVLLRGVGLGAALENVARPGSATADALARFIRATWTGLEQSATAAAEAPEPMRQPPRGRSRDAAADEAPAKRASPSRRRPR